MEQNAALASWALYSELYNSDKYNSQYQILVPFIKCAIIEERLRKFPASKIHNVLSNKFGFDIPIAVIITSLKKIKEIDYCKGEYTVKNNIELDENIKKRLSTAKETADSILMNFKQFVMVEKKGDVTEEEVNDLVNNFLKYLIDEEMEDNECNKLLFSRYALYCAENPEFKEQLSLIKSGSLIYLGLNYDVENIPCINDELVIYLATEILFYLAGYDGPLFQDLALEMIDLIKDVNKGKRTVVLKIFSKTKDEIERYFKTAEGFVNRNDNFIFTDRKRAMLSILDNCRAKSDVVNKKVRFYNTMQYHYGITVENDIDYYDSSYNEYNLEKIYDDEDKNKNIVYLSNINKLREGKKYNDYLNCKYLFITNSNCIRTLQDTLDIGGGSVKLAVSMNFFTNYLWLVLKKGFGASDMPKHLDALIKSRIILSDTIAKRFKQTFEKYSEDYRAKKISKEEVVACIALYKESIDVKPENLVYDSIDSGLNITPEEIGAYIEENEKRQHNELIKTKQIEQLELEKMQLQEDLSKSQSDISHYKQMEIDKDEIISHLKHKDNLQSEIESLNIELRNKRNKLIVFAIVYGAIFAFLVFICVKKHATIYNVASIIIGLLSLILPQCVSPSIKFNVAISEYIEIKNRQKEYNEKLRSLKESEHIPILTN